MQLHQNILTISLQNMPLKIITEHPAKSAAVNLLLIKSINIQASVLKLTLKNVRSLTLKLPERQLMQPVKESRRTPTLLHHARECQETRNLLPKQLHQVGKSLARFLSGSYRVCNLEMLLGL
jgi:hypothetical protein